MLVVEGPRRELRRPAVQAGRCCGGGVRRDGCGAEVTAGEELRCGERFQATSAAEVEVCGMVRGSTTVEPPRMGCCGCGLGVPSREGVAWGWNAPGESHCWHHAG